MKKKLLAILLAAVTVFSMTACDSDADKEAKNDDDIFAAARMMQSCVCYLLKQFRNFICCNINFSFFCQSYHPPFLLRCRYIYIIATSLLYVKK